MSAPIFATPLTVTGFADFGDVLEATGPPDLIINQGKCGRFHDLAQLDFSDGRAGISIFQATPRSFPHTLDMMERHPVGSQAFIPMSMTSFLIIVAADRNGAPDHPRAFVASPGQAINLHRNVWHAVLCPLEAPGLFAVVDRIGPGGNLEEHWLAPPLIIECGAPADLAPGVAKA